MRIDGLTRAFTVKGGVLFAAMLTVSAADLPAVKGLFHIGTLDKKLLVVDPVKEDVVGEIPLSGIPRVTALSTDQTKLHILTTKMIVETVELATGKVLSSFPLSDGTSNPRMVRSGGRGFSGMAVDPGGRYLYTTMKVAVKELTEYRVEPPKFIVIDLQEKKIAKSMDFPKGYDTGFGFGASYKISPDGKNLFVFDQDIVIFELATLKELERIELSKPIHPGASPFRLSASDDPNDDPGVATSIFTSVDPIVQRETLGMGKINLTTRKVEFTPIGPAFPMVGFAMSPDRKTGYSMMTTYVGGNRRTEWWVWDVDKKVVVRKKELPARPNFRFGISGDGKKLMVYGSGSTIEFFDTQTLISTKLLQLNKDTTTNIIARGAAR